MPTSLPAPPTDTRFPTPISARAIAVQALWVLGWNSAIALLFVVFFGKVDLPFAWVAANAIGYACWVFALMAATLLRPIAPWSIGLYVTAITIVAVPLGMVAGGHLVQLWQGQPVASIDWRGFLDRPTLGVTLLLGVIAVLFWHGRAREHKLAADAATRQAALEAQERRASEAQLKLLQAQLEPHFLFNTLGVLDGLIAAEPQRARRLLADLNDYLRAALSATRADARTHTLGDEIDLILAYLRIMQARFGPRLRCDVQVDAALREAPCPAMLLQPLVENAIRHGIEPAKDGGAIELHAGRVGDRIEIVVEDSGLGVRDGAPTRGMGTGLANIRARLHALYGSRGGLTLEERQPRGTIARLTLPA